MIISLTTRVTFWNKKNKNRVMTQWMLSQRSSIESRLEAGEYGEEEQLWCLQRWKRERKKEEKEAQVICCSLIGLILLGASHRPLWGSRCRSRPNRKEKKERRRWSDRSGRETVPTWNWGTCSVCASPTKCGNNSAKQRRTGHTQKKRLDAPKNASTVSPISTEIFSYLLVFSRFF